MENVLIFKFSSGSVPGLFAFAGDQAGSSLPERHGPWMIFGKVLPQERVPHGLDRKTVESAISDHGFQLWRMKRTETRQRQVQARAVHQAGKRARSSG